MRGGAKHDCVFFTLNCPCCGPVQAVLTSADYHATGSRTESANTDMISYERSVRSAGSKCQSLRALPGLRTKQSRFLTMQAGIGFSSELLVAARTCVGVPISLSAHSHREPIACAACFL